MTEAERIVELERIILALYRFAVFELLGMDEESRMRAIAGIDKKVRKLGILPPIK